MLSTCIAATRSLIAVGLMTAILSSSAMAQVNAGQIAPRDTLPFDITTVARFNDPWAIAFMPDGRMLVTEKRGRLFITTQKGEKHEISGVPPVQDSGQNGLLDVAVAPDFVKTRLVYISYVELGEGGSGLALARARLEENNGDAHLAELQVIWRQLPKGRGNQPGGIIAFSPQGEHVFLTSGDRRRPETAQDKQLALGKVIRLNLDGSTPADNPMAVQGGVSAQIWSMGHRNPYGLAFAPNGDLWQHEMGPRGGDELNHIMAGRNYGWPIVSNGDNYDGSVIPDHPTRPEFEAPAIYWTPVISPSGLAFYSGALFPYWNESALIGALSGAGLVRIEFKAKAAPKTVGISVSGYGMLQSQMTGPSG